MGMISPYGQGTQLLKTNQHTLGRGRTALGDVGILGSLFPLYLKNKKKQFIKKLIESR
jgi:hypothetical protein